MTEDRIICEVSMIADPIAARLVCHAISAHISGVSMTSATAAARAGYCFCNSRVWSRNFQEYSSWSWGGCFVVLDDIQRVKVPDKVMT